MDNTPAAQVSLLRFYTLLLQRWTITLEATKRPVFLPGPTVAPLVFRVNELALTLTQTSPTVSTHLHILDFYEAATTLYSKTKRLPYAEIVNPPPLLVYILFLGPSLAVVSRLCGILATYKRAWAVVTTPGAKREMSKLESLQVKVFNGFLMDICNCLWRGRAFSTTDTNAQGCRIPEPAQAALRTYIHAADSDLSLETAFGLSHSPLLCLLSDAYVKQLEEDEMEDLRARHAGPVTQRSLGQLAKRGGLNLSWQDYRSGVLSYLESKGFPGIPELIRSTMKSAGRAEGAATKQ